VRSDGSLWFDDPGSEDCLPSERLPPTLGNPREQSDGSSLQSCASPSLSKLR